MDQFLDKVFVGNAIDLLKAMPSAAVHAVISDPMYMVAKIKGKSCKFDWGDEPGAGRPEEWLAYHQEIYHQCLRVLKPGGSLAFAMGCKFRSHFADWFGGYRIWGFSRYLKHGCNPFSNIWVVQTKEQTGISFPDDDGLLEIGQPGWWGKYHPCPKSEEEMRFLVRHLTQPGQIVLDPFCGSGSTLVAAQELGRYWIGCDLSRTYARVALRGLFEYR